MLVLLGIDSAKLVLYPQIRVSASGESIGLGIGLHWKLFEEISLVSEANLPINNAENNMTFAKIY